MNCYDRYKDGAEEKAVGIRGRHAVEESRAATAQALIHRVVELPLRARLLLCGACLDAPAQ